MNRKLMISLSILLFSFLIYPHNDSFGIENRSDILMGYVDNDGIWKEKGEIYFEIPHNNSVDELISLKYGKELSDKYYLEIPYMDVKAFVSIKEDQRFQVYSKDGYMGDYNLYQFVILVDRMSGSKYLYIKLNGKISIKGDNYLVAKIINKDSQNKVAKVIIPANMHGLEKAKIEKILSSKLNHARKKFISPKIIELEKKRGQRVNFKLEYQAFKFNNLNRNDILVNAIWSCKDEALESEFGYYFTNTFLVSNNRIVEMEPLKDLDIVNDIKIAILWGIDIDIDNKIKWVAEYGFFEGSQPMLIEWDGDRRVVIVAGKYFGL